MRFFTAAFVSALAALASATSYTQPDYTQAPSGNAIVKPGLNEIVPVGKPYTITWQPTTEGPVSLVLLRGPSTNVVPLETLAVAIPNSGSFQWTPGSELEPDVSHYGLLLVVEGTGQYQYSTQFGISNEEYGSKPSSSAGEEAPQSTVIVTDGVTTTICPETLTAAPTTIPVVVPTSKPVVPTTFSSSVAVPSTTAAPTQAPTTSGPSTPVFTGAADRMAVSFGAVAAGVAAVLAF